MSSFFNNVRKFIGHHGLREVFFRLLRYIAKPVYANVNFKIVRLSAFNVSEPHPDIRVSELTLAEVDDLLPVVYVDRKGVVERFSQNDRCFAVREDGKIVSFTWIRTRQRHLPELEMSLSLQPNQAWVYNAITARESRGKGLYSNILRFAAKKLASEGTDEIYGDVNSFNKASIKGFEKAGFEIIADVHMRRFLTYRIYDVCVFNSEVWSRLSGQIQNEDLRRATWRINGESRNLPK